MSLKALAAQKWTLHEENIIIFLLSVIVTDCQWFLEHDNFYRKVLCVWAYIKEKKGRIARVIAAFRVEMPTTQVNRTLK